MNNKEIKIGRKIILLVIIIVCIVLMQSLFVTTYQNEYTVIREFGTIEKVVREPGLSLKKPFIQSVTKLPSNIIYYDLPQSDVITMDKKTMVTDMYVLWRITDPLLFAQTLNSSVGLAESRIDTVVYNAMKNVISSLSQADVINGRDGQLSESIVADIGNSMEQYGIVFETVENKQLDLPGDNKAAVFERMISERDKIAATFTAEGESEAKMIKNTTDKEIAISISDAEREAAKITAEGESTYMKILSQAYSDADRSEFYAFTRALDSLKYSLAGGDKTIILSSDSPIARIFYNLD